MVVFAVHVGGAAMALMHWQEDETSEDAAGAIMVELAPQPAATPIDSPDVAHGPLMEEAAPTPQASKRTTADVEKETPLVDPSPLAPEPEVVVPVRQPIEDKKPDDLEAQEIVRQKQSPDQASAAPLTMAPPRVDVEAAPSSAAPAPATSASLARVQASWEKALINHLNRHKRYPDAARSRSAQGVVVVAFRLDRSGQLVASQITQSSGSAALDEEALAVLKRASPMPAPPEQIAGPMLDLGLPIQFRIR